MQHATFASVEDAPHGGVERRRVAGHQLEPPPRDVHEDDVRHTRRENARRLSIGAPGRAGEDGQPALRVHGAAATLALEQDPAGGVQGGGTGRRGRRHAGHRPSGQRRELLRGAPQQLGGDEEPGGEV